MLMYLLIVWYYGEFQPRVVAEYPSYDSCVKASLLYKDALKATVVCQPIN